MDIENGESNTVVGTIDTRRTARTKIIIAMVVLAALLGGLWLGVINKPIFKIDGKTYRRIYVQRLTASALHDANLKPQSAAERRVFEILKEKAAVEKLGYTLGDAVPQTLKTWNDLVAYDLAVQNYYNILQTGRYTGYVFVFDFSQHILPSNPATTARPQQNNAALIGGDKEYAQKQATSYYDQFSAHKVTADALYKSLKKNKYLNYNGGSSKFTTTNAKQPLASQIVYQDAYNYVITQKVPGVSKLQTGRLPTTYDPSIDPGLTPAYFFFVDLTSVQQPVADPAGVIAKAIAALPTEYHAL